MPDSQYSEPDHEQNGDPGLGVSNGADVLIGGNGDTLTGGNGPDTFVFRPNFGANTITGVGRRSGMPL